MGSSGWPRSAGGWRFLRSRAYGVGAADVPVLVEKAAQASSMKANPIALNSDELSGILERAI